MPKLQKLTENIRTPIFNAILKLTHVFDSFSISRNNFLLCFIQLQQNIFEGFDKIVNRKEYHKF